MKKIRLPVGFERTKVVLCKTTLGLIPYGCGDDCAGIKDTGDIRMMWFSCTFPKSIPPEISSPSISSRSRSGSSGLFGRPKKTFSGCNKDCIEKAKSSVLPLRQPTMGGSLCPGGAQAARSNLSTKLRRHTSSQRQRLLCIALRTRRAANDNAAARGIVLAR